MSREVLPQISIIVPVYNSEDLLADCVNSILKQTFKDFELILIDDGSKDSSLNICKAFAKEDSRIIVLHKENGGQGSARNLGLDHCRGEYICFVDSDDRIDLFYLEKLFKKCTVSGAAICNLDQFDTDYFKSKEEFMRNLLVDNIGSQLWRVMFHRSLWDNIRIPESRYAEDAMVLHKVLNKAVTIEFINEKLYLYNYSNENSSSNNQKNKLKNAMDRALMFFERLKWIKVNGYVECEDIILCKAIGFSVGAIGCYKNYDYNSEDISLICRLINDNFLNIMKNRQISIARKVAVILIKISPEIYYGVRGIWKRN